MNWRRERADQRTSARLVELELRGVTRLLRLWLDISRLAGEWWEPLAQWPVHAPILASRLSPEEWDLVSGVFYEIDQLGLDVRDIQAEGDKEIRRLRSSLDPGSPGAVQARERIEGLINLSEQAASKLSAVAR